MQRTITVDVEERPAGPKPLDGGYLVTVTDADVGCEYEIAVHTSTEEQAFRMGLAEYLESLDEEEGEDEDE